MKVGDIVKLKNPNGDDNCVGIVEGHDGGKVLVVYFPATSPVEHKAFDVDDLTAV